ncbi:hypothetical protein QYF61_016660 [Mycteria americana]|uniref:Activated RNA polymerase II transcriptional coactivator p15 n=1 Tax=Mycteria americana TaxID=33587 RepID=A0AAN7NAV6_MYCAM|nr:hypothetical protein QYF61_016660 [Mycteria americana]
MSSKSEKRLKTEAKPSKVTEKPLGQGSEDEGMFQIGKMRYVRVSCFKGKVLVDVREFYADKEGSMRPGRKGTTVFARRQPGVATASLPQPLPVQLWPSLSPSVVSDDVMWWHNLGGPSQQHYLSSWGDYNMLSWFNPSLQLSPTQPLAHSPLHYVLSMTSYGVGYPFGQLGSDVPAVSPPSSLCPPSLLAGVVPPSNTRQLYSKSLETPCNGPWVQARLQKAEGLCESMSVKSLGANSRLLHLLALNKCFGSSTHRWGQQPGLEKEGLRFSAKHK